MKFSEVKGGVLLTHDDTRYRVVGRHVKSQVLHVIPVEQSAVTDEEPFLEVSFEDAYDFAHPGPLDQIHPMLAKTFKGEVQELIDDPNIVFEEKYDGERCILTFAGVDQTLPREDEWVGRFKATTRVVGKNSGLLGVNSQKLPHLAELPIPDGKTVFDGELMFFSPKLNRDEAFRQLRAIMGSGTEKALERQQELGWVRFIAFDVLWFDGVDLRDTPFEERQRVLDLFWYDTISGSGHQPFFQVSHVAWEAEEKEHMLRYVQSEGGEGVMAKKLDGKYTDTARPGRRSSDVLKVKPFLEEDVVILDFEMGQGMYNKNRFGAIVFGQYMDEDRARSAEATIWEGEGVGAFEGDKVMVVMGSCSGFTQEQEEAFRTSPDSYIGQVMTVKYQSRWQDTGLFRHPNFVRVRDDKPATDCVY